MRGRLTPGVTRPHTTKQAPELTDERHADSGRVHAVVRRSDREPYTSAPSSEASLFPASNDNGLYD